MAVEQDTRRMRPIGEVPEDTGLFCPECGAAIPDGMLYCEACGEEIHFVSDFEPEVDDSIMAAMSGVADEIAGSDENTGSLYAGEEEKDDGYIDLHIRFPKRYLRYAGIAVCAVAIVAAAVITIPKVLKLQVFDRDTRASGTIIEQTGPKQENGSAEPDQTEIRPAGYTEEEAPAAPEFDNGSGRYEAGVMISIVGGLQGNETRYYYTTDGTKADENATRYVGPILLSEEGEYQIRAVAVNRDGKMSEETIGVYQIEPAVPPAPVILEESGEYTQSTMIVVVMQEGCSVTYTTDGSEPEADSTAYTTPIMMPVGNSVFKFRSFDSAGVGSETVERSYHLVYARLVSEEQAVASVMQVLMDKKVLIDATGKVLGADGRNAYHVDSVIEIEGAGEYYRIIEQYVAPDQTVVDTGLLYAVNTNDGSVHRLGYDSSGKYTLFTLSGR
ncbi:MAG: chitobiase/beta-hexosaminidase C-terminal domain-containing protein [Lachnospiraceae bacterium]|nr:chitobiase/beta-hexosaminidase C-terminal domain-containing protein [Lachnospiraceae bacterium]